MGLLDNVMGAVGGVIDNTIGLPFQMIGNQMQQNQNQALTNQQLNANEALSAYNYQQQYKLWQETNYPAQVQQLQQAGLNPALLYAKGGPGGTTGAPSGGMGMGQAAPQPFGLPTQAAATGTEQQLQAAEQKKTEAQTPLQADLLKAEIASINQGTNNAKATEILTDAQTQMQRLNNSIQGETMDDQIANIRATASKVQIEMQQATRNNWMDAQTVNDKIKTIQGIMIGTFLQNNMTQAQTGLTKQQINESISRITQAWKTIGINQQNADTNEGHLKLQQLIKDVPDSRGILMNGLTKLIPSIIMGL